VSRSCASLPPRFTRRVSSDAGVLVQRPADVCVHFRGRYMEGSCMLAVYILCTMDIYTATCGSMRLHVPGMTQNKLTKFIYLNVILYAIANLRRLHMNAYMYMLVFPFKV
jgi:hypothetical protein